MTNTPFGDGGRSSNGRFAPGNRGGPGNPLAGKISKLRAALVAAVTEDDIHEIARSLIATAKGGDVRAVKELLDRTIGRPVETDLIERLESLETALKDVETDREMRL
tara:strand:+ start:961 stop:1281 length:321 start_codon:yes stop_codon:yes gene_type:complete